MSGDEIVVSGWVKERRDLGGITFINLRDKKGFIQITASKKDTPSEVFKLIRRLAGEYVISVIGIVQEQPKAFRGIELSPKKVKILATANHPLPLDTSGKVPADIDTRLDSRILDLRRTEPNAIFHIRHEVLKKIREFLSSEGFIEVQTPRIISSAAEGGAALFEIKYFNKTAYLAQSPELYKEQLATAFERVYEIGPFFRAEESHSRRHLNEFTSVDIEAAFVDWNDVMNIQEKLIHEVINHVLNTCQEKLEILSIDLQLPSIPFKQYTYTEIVEELIEFEFKIEWGEDIPTQAYRKLGELHKKEYYFITNWPLTARPFYIKAQRETPKISCAFDAMFEWIEITSGGSRVEKKQMLIERLKEQKLNPQSFDFFLKVFDYGMPPHAGWGMGLDRFLMAMLGKENIREVILFPRDRLRLIP